MDARERGLIDVGPAQLWRRSRLSLHAVLCAVILVGLASVVMSEAHAASAPSLDPAAIGCPTAPPGWGKPPVSKLVATPQSVPAATPNPDEREAQGGDTATVTCSYHDTAAKEVVVVASFALPTDPNPVSDFDLGCGRGAVSWDATNRVYRDPSSTQWALASLLDSSRVLGLKDVNAFEIVTRELLQNVHGYGHPCTLLVQPTAVPGSVYFDIRVTGATLKNTFLIAPSPGKGGTYRIEHASALAARLTVQTTAGRRALAIRLITGIDYRPQASHHSGEVRFSVLVTASEVPSCARGAHGVLTISTAPSVSLSVCGQTLRVEASTPVEFFDT